MLHLAIHEEFYQDERIKKYLKFKNEININSVRCEIVNYLLCVLKKNEDNIKTGTVDLSEIMDIAVMTKSFDMVEALHEKYNVPITRVTHRMKSLDIDTLCEWASSYKPWNP